MNKIFSFTLATVMFLCFSISTHQVEAQESSSQKRVEQFEKMPQKILESKEKVLRQRVDQSSKELDDVVKELQRREQEARPKLSSQSVPSEGTSINERALNSSIDELCDGLRKKYPHDEIPTVHPRRMPALSARRFSRASDFDTLEEVNKTNNTPKKPVNKAELRKIKEALELERAHQKALNKQLEESKKRLEEIEDRLRDLDSAP